MEEGKVLTDEMCEASFGFGEEIGAVASWGRGEDLEMVKANDEKSKVIALVWQYFEKQIGIEMSNNLLDVYFPSICFAVWGT